MFYYEKCVFLLRNLYTSSLVRSSFIYVFCDAINKAIPFLILPFITHYLTPADYGAVTNFNVYMQIASVFCHICTSASLPVMFYKLEKSEIQKYVSNMIFFNTSVNIFCVIASFFACNRVEEMLSFSFYFQFLGLLVVWFTGITNINMILWRCEEKPLSFGIYQISQSALNSLSTILFVIVLLLGWQGRIYSIMLTAISFGIISVLVLYRRGYLMLTVDKVYVLRMFSFALPIIPHALSFWFKGGIDKVMLTDMCGLSENGLYSAAMTFGAIATMILTSFNNAYTPYLFKSLANFDEDKVGTKLEQLKIVKMIWVGLLLTLFVLILVYFLSVLLIDHIYSASYLESKKYLLWIMIDRFFYGCYLFFVVFFHYTIRMKLLGGITFLLSIFQIFISYIMIVNIGSMGVAVASASVSFLTFVFVVYFAMRIYNLPWLLDK